MKRSQLYEYYNFIAKQMKTYWLYKSLFPPVEKR